MGRLKPGQPLLAVRPFRSPHHTISNAGLVGGGSTPSPGEISLAHNGVLFLDELPEFNRQTLEVLRQPLEDGTVTISRALEQHDVSGQFHADRGAESLPLRLSRRPAAELPLHAAADRAVHEQDFRPAARPHRHPHRGAGGGLSGAVGRRAGHAQRRDAHARWRRPAAVQAARFDGGRTRYNADMTHRQTRQFCQLDDECQNLLKAAMTELGLSARAHDKILRVARTIADLDHSDDDPPDAPQRSDQLPHAGSALVDVRGRSRGFLANDRSPCTIGTA